MVDASRASPAASLHVQKRGASAPDEPKPDSGTITLRRAFRYRLHPTPEQAVTLGQWSGVCRLIYNLAWEQRRDFWRQHRKSTGRAISFVSQSAELAALRADYDWIAEAPFDAETYALRDLDRAFTNFFAGRANYPTPRHRHGGHGFRLKGRSCRVRQVSARWATVRLPKLGEVRFRITRPITGQVRNVSVSCTAGMWHVAFAADWEADARSPAPDGVGVDLGVARSVTLSTGEHHHAPGAVSTQRAQRDLSRKTKGSARYAKQARRVAKLKARDARRRADWAHKTSTSIADRFGLVVVEDLKIANMTASAAGTVEEPGKNVAQKRGLNRAILAQGWGQLTTQLAYKLEERGGQLTRVDPKHTSQTCASCGAVDARSRESQAVFRCVHCGHADNADVNAAKEILRRGTAGLGAEAEVARPVRRQSQELQHV